MAEIKTVLPKPRIRIDEFGDITPITGNSRFVTGDFYDADQMREAIEAAVLSANAGKVDAERRYEIVRKMNVHQFTTLFKLNMAGEGRFDDLVDQLGQQAIDAGKV